MTSSNQSDRNQTPQSQSAATADDTVDVRDLVTTPHYSKDPREVIENPAVTPQMIDESDDSQAGMDRSDS